MKTLLALALVFAGPFVSLSAPDDKSAKAADTEKAPAGKKSADIKDLMLEPVFTNASEMVMVKISPSMWAGKYLVTQEEYQKVAGGNPSQFGGARNPVDSGSWNDARNFCAKLNEAERKDDM